jgi:hypothetical protein
MALGVFDQRLYALCGEFESDLYVELRKNTVNADVRFKVLQEFQSGKMRRTRQLYVKFGFWKELTWQMFAIGFYRQEERLVKKTWDGICARYDLAVENGVLAHHGLREFLAKDSALRVETSLWLRGKPSSQCCILEDAAVGLSTTKIMLQFLEGGHAWLKRYRRSSRSADVPYLSACVRANANYDDLSDPWLIENINTLARSTTQAKSIGGATAARAMNPNSTIPPELLCGRMGVRELTSWACSLQTDIRYDRNHQWAENVDFANKYLQDATNGVICSIADGDKLAFIRSSLPHGSFCTLDGADSVVEPGGSALVSGCFQILEPDASEIVTPSLQHQLHHASLATHAMMAISPEGDALEVMPSGNIVRNVAMRKLDGDILLGKLNVWVVDDVVWALVIDHVFVDEDLLSAALDFCSKLALGCYIHGQPITTSTFASNMQAIESVVPQEVLEVLKSEGVLVVSSRNFWLDPRKLKMMTFLKNPETTRELRADLTSSELTTLELIDRLSRDGSRPVPLSVCPSCLTPALGHRVLAQSGRFRMYV